MVQQISIEGLHKFYGKNQVLHNITLSITTPLSLAIVGPNGHGKTTLLKCLLNLVPFESGTIKMDGLSHQHYSSRASMSFLPERFTFYPQYTVAQALDFLLSMARCSFQPHLPEQAHLLEELELQQHLKKSCRHLSKGQLQRMGLVSCLLSNSNLIILDEPFSGLDPLGQKQLRDLMARYRQQGRSFIVNTHQLSEVEKIANHLLILHEGRMKFFGSLSTIQKPLEDFFLQTIHHPTSSLSSSL